MTVFYEAMAGWIQQLLKSSVAKGVFFIFDNSFIVSSSNVLKAVLSSDIVACVFALTINQVPPLYTKAKFNLWPRP